MGGRGASSGVGASGRSRISLRRGSAANEQLQSLKVMYLQELGRPGSDLNLAKIQMTIEDIETNGYHGQNAFSVSDKDARTFIKKRAKG